jgi:hypothetical protein
MRVERSDGPTPGGGAYAQAIIGDDGRIYEITEHAADGSVIARHYGAAFVERGGPGEEPDDLEPRDR